jgi:hypothetical protein
MKVVLVGWEIDDAVAGALAGLGTELVAFTRWFPDRAVREDCGGWLKVRCPHRIGGGLEAEALAFRDAVLEHATVLGVGGEVDVVHALDPLARPAAGGLRQRAPTCAAIATITPADLGSETDPALEFPADRWICDHPWLAERWRETVADGWAPPLVIAGRLDPPPPSSASVPAEAGADGPVWVLWAPRDAPLDPRGIVAALAAARASIAGLKAAVLGEGPAAEAARRRLGERGWLARAEPAGPGDATLACWQAWLARAAVVGVPAASLADDPTARLAWLAGVPVVRVDTADPGTLAEALRDALLAPARRHRGVRAGAALARSRLEPARVAIDWLRAYLDARAAQASAPAAAGGEAEDWPAPPVHGGRSRLNVLAIAPRQAYAAWTVRPEDWAVALEWLGPDAVRAALALRLWDVADLDFRGSNPHAAWEIELGPAERHRTIQLDAPGRSLAAALGVQSPRGVFHPLAHARICHLPREELAPARAARRLNVLPRWNHWE